MEQNSNDTHLISRIIDWVFSNLLLITLYVFSMVAKLYTSLAYKKRMRPIECVVDHVLSAIGGALIIYVLTKIKMPLWLFCAVASISSMVVTPFTTIVAKEITPLLTILFKGVENILKKWVSKQEKKI